MRWLLWLAPLSACQAQQLSEDLLVLAKAKVKMVENLEHLPNYTCSETIERSRQPVSAKHPSSQDTIRLEVALVAGRELYGWPGSNRIAESELTTLVGGTIGNGDFGLLAKSIFQNSGTQFTYAGPEALQGRPTILYHFRVPLISSGYHISVPPNQAIVGYHGSFWLDQTSLDLLRLEVAADDIPEYLGLASTAKTIEYDRTRIGAADFLLPKGSELTMVDFRGIESRNRTRFHSCRQYSGESVLSFEDPLPSPDRPDLEPLHVSVIDLPPSFSAELSLVTPLDSNTAAIGDPIQVRLEDNIKAGRRLIAPKGAVLSGRISLLHKQTRYTFVGFTLQALDFEQGHADLTARANTLSLVNRPRPGSLQGIATGLPHKEEDPMVFEGSHVKLPKGLLFYLHSRLLKSDKQ